MANLVSDSEPLPDGRMRGINSYGTPFAFDNEKPRYIIAQLGIFNHQAQIVCNLFHWNGSLGDFAFLKQILGEFLNIFLRNIRYVLA
jgi:hypothetical protein